MPVDRNFTTPFLIAQIKNQDSGAFAKIYDMYAGVFLSAINRLVKNKEQSEDILQEVFIKIWRASPSYDAEKGTFFTWALTIIKNTTKDYFLSKKYQTQQAQLELNSDHFFIPAIENNTINKKYLFDMVYGLDLKYRNIIDLVYITGYTYEETAVLLKMLVGTLKSRARTALQDMRKKIQQQEKSTGYAVAKRQTAN